MQCTYSGQLVGIGQANRVPECSRLILKALKTGQLCLYSFYLLFAFIYHQIRNDYHYKGWASSSKVFCHPFHPSWYTKSNESSHCWSPFEHFGNKHVVCSSAVQRSFCTSAAHHCRRQELCLCCGRMCSVHRHWHSIYRNPR